MATCADVAGAKYPSEYQGNPIQPLEGLSLLPILESGQRPGHSEICWEHEGNRAIREGKWKLVSRYPDQWELHDMEADRTEVHDLAPERTAQVEAMAERWGKWASRCNVLPWDDIRNSRG
jgi:arylsulfatase